MDNLKAILTESYSKFIKDLAGTKDFSAKSLEERMKVHLDEMFSRQKTADLVKKDLGPDFKKAVALYFERYQTKDGINHQRLLADLEKNKSALEWHLKKDVLRYVQLVAELMSQVDTKPKGLLL